MESIRFDGLIRRISHDGLDRRDAVKAVVSAALGLATIRAAIDTSAATNLQGKKKKCVKTGTACPTDPSKCCGKQCCTDIGDAGQFCAPKNSACCRAGGACASKNPVCCEDQSGATTGCAPAGAVCCPDGAHYCPSPNTACCPDGTCCQGDNCCANAQGASDRASASRRQHAQIHGRRQRRP